MACGEHHCTQCNWVDFSNDYIQVCPMCGSHVVTFLDEPEEVDMPGSLDTEEDFL